MSQISTVENAQSSFNTLGDDQIKVTAAAHQQLKALLDAEDEEEVMGLRIFVAGGGCSGMTYGMTFATERFAHDAVQEQDGVTLYVDAVALSFLEGAEIDFQEQPAGASFVFRNVFQAVGGGGTCAGCGHAQG
ncbi:MAG TPA: iron-sulfur cluster assembly accessory protein [Gammaproteobacteria bacterium]|jgi:iron-sulfur cluster insertion protein|nr:iron-sulfur cluster assembly accessory protein [Gammaproteobacteria bacterium]